VDAAKGVDAALWRITQWPQHGRFGRVSSAPAFRCALRLGGVHLEDSAAAGLVLGRVRRRQLGDVGHPDADADALRPPTREVGDGVDDLRAGGFR